MELIEQLCSAVLNFGKTLGAFLIPAIILSSIALVLLSRYSYKLFRILFPLLGATVGFFAGKMLLTPILEPSLAAVAQYVNPSYVVGAACALLLLIVCLAFYRLAINLIGAGVGYIISAKLLIPLMSKTAFVSQVLLNSDAGDVIVFNVVIGIFCAGIMLGIFNKFFDVIYIYGTAIICATASVLIPTIFIFQNSSILEGAVITVICVISDIGILLGRKQHYLYY